MGFMGRDEDIRPLYSRSFRFLSEQGCDWRYALPAIFLLSLKDLRDEKDNPEAAVRERLVKEREAEKLRSGLDEVNRDAFERAVDAPPVVVQAYRKCTADGRRTSGTLCDAFVHTVDFGREIPMSVEDFLRMPWRLGWKHAYFDDRAYLSPSQRCC